MIKTFTIYSLFFLITALVSFFAAFIALRRKHAKGALEVALLMIASGIGATFLIFETSASILSEKIFWAKLEFIGGTFVPVFYLIFVLRYTGHDKFLSPKHIISIIVVPIITLVLIFTNEKHNLIWTGYSAISQESNLMVYYHGICFWVGYVLYSYILLFIGSVYIFCFILRHKKAFLYQGWIIFIGGLLPWSASFLYLADINVTPGLDLTPASIALSGAMLIYAFFNNRFLDLVPVARETLVETLQDGIIVLDDQNRIQDVNSAALNYLGIKNKNNLGLFADDSGASVIPLLNAITKNGQTERVEIKKGNELIAFKIIKQTIKNQQGSRLVIIRDISESYSQQQELIKAKERAEESDRLKSAFLANMSHEIRTPMSGILGFTELLREVKISEDEQQEYLGIIEKSGTRMLNIINDLMSISTLEAGLMKTSISEVDVNKQINLVYKTLKPQAQEKGIKLFLNKNLPLTEGKKVTDREKLSAILTNLVKNAIKFTQSGSIELGCSRNQYELEFFVKDTGIGILPEQKEYIFERFRQGSESFAREYEGAGLGLSIAKAYVELLGGRIWVESEPAIGSTFFFTIPDKRDITLSL